MPALSTHEPAGDFFAQPDMEAQLLARVCAAADRAGIWERLATDWLCLDCELMPWSAKAQELLRSQYAPVGSAGRHALSSAVRVLEQTAPRLDEATQLLDAYRQRQPILEGYINAYRQYCWPVESVADLKLAPFHLLASEGHVHVDRAHAWHMGSASATSASTTQI